MSIAYAPLILVWLASLWFDTRRTFPESLPRLPDNADAFVSRAINAVNHDMRSVELGRWMIDQLKRYARCDTDDFSFLSYRIPGINAVAAQEVAVHLGSIMNLACEINPKAPSQALDDIGARTLGKGGLLVGMPAYRKKSPVKLPI